MELIARAIHELKWLAFRCVEWLNRAASTVGAEPFPDASLFPWTAAVERAAGAVVAELGSVQATQSIPNFQDISVDQRDITDDDRWKTFFLYGYGHRDEPNCSRCPATDRALRAIPRMRTATFSILAPGKVIPPHRGPYNGVLRYHLGLVVPDGGATSGIRVGGLTRSWQVGRSLIFDDTFEHEAWNHSSEQRVVLFAIRRSRFVEDAMENLRTHREKSAARSMPLVD